MGNYKHLEEDFIHRTLKVLEQYDTLDLPTKNKFEVTLLTNSFLGLIVVPDAKNLVRFLPKERIELSKHLGLSRVHIASLKIKYLRDLIAYLRNSVAHFDIKFEGSEEEIETIIFSDNDNGKGELARFSPSEIRKVIRGLARIMIIGLRKERGDDKDFPFTED